MHNLIVTVMVALLALTGCGRNSRMAATMEPTNDPKQAAVLSDESQIKIVIYEHLIRHVLRASTNNVLFISVTDSEYAALTSTFPKYKLRSAARAEITADRRVQDKASRETGVVLEVKWVNIDGQKAEAYAGYFAGAGVTFTFDLKKGTDWSVEKVSDATVSD